MAINYNKINITLSKTNQIQGLPALLLLFHVLSLFFLIIINIYEAIIVYQHCLLNIMDRVCHIALTTTLRGTYYYYSHCANKLLRVITC